MTMQRDGTNNRPPNQPPPYIWSKYRVKGPLGEGGMATVYSVIDEEKQQVFAAKVLRQDRAQQNPYLRLQFEQEAQIHPRLAHPNILRCHQAFLQEEPQGLLLDYIEGGTLRRYIRSRKDSKINSDEIMLIVRQVADALEYLHSQGLCHCDIKPDNILINQQGQVFLTDFGISQSIGEPLESKRGTPRYMAPEQYLQQPVDHRTDVYSFAITLYEMLTQGEVPFSAHAESEESRGSQGAQHTVGQAASLEEKHIYSKPPPPSFFNDRIKREIDQVLLRALEKEPDRRYQRMSNLYQALDTVVSGQSQHQTFSQTDGFVPPPPQHARAKLICTTGQSSTPIPLEPLLLFGRSKECNVRLRDISISRRHALVQWEATSQQYVIWDQGSKLGTRVNGKQVINTARVLQHGDLITVGNYNFRYELGSLSG